MSDAAQLEREAEAARARLAETADQLKARMSPGQMMDEVLNQFRDGDGNQMLANLRNQARDNPMALALVGSGLAWLMMGSGPSAPQAGDRAPAGTGATPYRPQAPGGFPAFGGTAETGWPGSGSARPGDAPSSAGGIGEAVRDAGSQAVESLRSAGSEAVGTLRSAGSEAASTLHDAAGAIRSAGSDAFDSLRERAGAVGHSARDYGAAGEERLAQLGHGAADLGHQARRTLADVLEREPLVIGAIGLAVGAAIGALLPASALERQHLGATGEALRDRASTLLDQGVSAARDAAAEVYETARDEADRQGLVPGDRPLAEKVDAVVRAAGTAAGEIAHKHVAALDPAEGDEEPGTEGGSGDTTPQTSRT